MKDFQLNFSSFFRTFFLEAALKQNLFLQSVDRTVADHFLVYLIPSLLLRGCNLVVDGLNFNQFSFNHSPTFLLKPKLKMRVLKKTMNERKQLSIAIDTIK